MNMGLMEEGLGGAGVTGSWGVFVRFFLDFSKRHEESKTAVNAPILKINIIYITVLLVMKITHIYSAKAKLSEN